MRGGDSNEKLSGGMVLAVPTSDGLCPHVPPLIRSSGNRANVLPDLRSRMNCDGRMWADENSLSRGAMAITWFPFHHSRSPLSEMAHNWYSAKSRECHVSDLMMANFLFCVAKSTFSFGESCRIQKNPSGLVPNSSMSTSISRLISISIIGTTKNSADARAWVPTPTEPSRKCHGPSRTLKCRVIRSLSLN